MKIRKIIKYLAEKSLSAFGGIKQCASNTIKYFVKILYYLHKNCMMCLEAFNCAP